MFLKKERPLDRDTEMRREPQTSHDTQISPGPGERGQEMSPTQPDTGQAESLWLCPSPLTSAIRKPRPRIWVQRGTPKPHKAKMEKHLGLHRQHPAPDGPCLLSAWPAPHSTPTTAATIILANFALAMWTVGWFLLYFVALSNIS